MKTLDELTLLKYDLESMADSGFNITISTKNAIELCENVGKGSEEYRIQSLRNQEARLTQIHKNVIMEVEHKSELELESKMDKIIGVHELKIKKLQKISLDSETGLNKKIKELISAKRSSDDIFITFFNEVRECVIVRGEEFNVEVLNELINRLEIG